MHVQNPYGPTPSWKQCPEHLHEFRSIYGMWAPGSSIFREGLVVTHLRADGREELIYEGNDPAFRDYVHDRGLLIENRRGLYLAKVHRGKPELRRLWGGQYDRFEPCSEGVIVQADDTIRFAPAWGACVTLYQGPFDAWRAHPRGAVIRLGSTLVLATKDGKRVLVRDLKNPVMNGEERWLVHMDGAVYQEDDCLILAKGGITHHVLFDATSTMRKAAPSRFAAGLELFSPGESSKDFHHDLRASGYSWTTHPDGLLVQHGDALDLVTRTGERVRLYQGHWDGYTLHPFGAVIRKGHELALYDGEHPPMAVDSVLPGARWGATQFSGINVATMGPARVII